MLPVSYHLTMRLCALCGCGSQKCLTETDPKTLVHISTLNGNNFKTVYRIYSMILKGCNGT